MTIPNTTNNLSITRWGRGGNLSVPNGSIHWVSYPNHRVDTMLTDNNQIFRYWFVIIHRNLTKVSAQIIQCIIFERNELSITLSTLWLN